MEGREYQFHLIVLTYMIQSGVVIFALPRILGEVFGTNGWIAILPLSAIVILNIWLFSYVYKRIGERSMFEVISIALPKWIYYLLFFIIIVLWCAIAALVLKQFAIIIQIIFFPTTHVFWFITTMFIIVFVFLNLGIMNMVKVTTIFFYFSIWTLLLGLIFLEEFDFVRLTSFLFKDGDLSLFQIGSVYTSFLGFEIMFLLTPYVKKSAKLVRSMIFGNLLTTFVYGYTSLICFGFYSLQQLVKIQFPTLELFAYVEAPFLERVDNLIVPVFIIKIIVTGVFFVWGEKEALHYMVTNVKEKKSIIIVVVFAYIITYFFTTYTELETWLTHIAVIEIGMAFGLPLLVLLLLPIARRKVQL